MKKYLLIFSTVAMLLAGCSREQIEEQNGGGLQTVCFTANLDNGATTKAVADGDGLGTNATRCILELYYGDELYYRDTQPVNNMVAEFNNITLVSNRTYEVLVWADAGAEYYNAEDLKAVKMVATQYIANDDKRDAFFYRGQQQVAQRGEAYSVQLRRPFAQVNIITLDAPQVKSASLYPENVWTKYKAPTKFNIYTGELSEVTYLTVSGPVYAPFSSTASALTLEMDYLFADTERAALDIDFKAKHAAEADVVYAFTNIPIQRNYRTNIQGKLLTTTGSWTATIVPDWDGTHSVDYIEAGSIAAANEALKTNNAVSIEHPNDLGTAIVIPSERDGENIYITVTGASAGDIVIEKAQNGPASLDIESDSKTLNINLPNSHVNINKGDYTSVTAKTSATTLVVGKDVEIDTLNILAGNAEIYGKVTTELIRADGVKVAMYASNRATLINYINWAKTGDAVYLDYDIDLAGENWTPLRKDERFTATFDGQGHTISNMTIAVDWANGVGFFSDMTGGAVIKNFTMDNASVANTTADKGNMYGIVSGYAYGNVTFENIVVKNSNIHAFGKVSAILGMAADGSGTTTVKNCKVENTEIIGCYNVANYVGLLQNAIVLEGCTSTNVTKSIGGRYGEETYVTFDNVKVINNSDPANPKYVLSSGKYWKYISGDDTYYYSAFADCYNDIHYNGWKALDGTVDGLVFNTPETPQPIDLEPVATIGTIKYYDLPSALAALQQGETLEIVQAGEYTVQTLSAPANSIIDAKVEGVVFNRTAGGWVANQNDGRTVKNITWNVGNANYQYFHGVNLVNCKVNGILCTHSNNTYTDCEFYNADGYNFWEYGTGSTFVRCKFTCSGKNDGEAGAGGCVNAYNEGEQGLKKVIFDNCQFIALNATNKYAAVYIKHNSSFDVEFVNCTANENFCTGAISGSKLWNVNNNTNLNHKVTVDDKLVYANGTVLNITTADQLMAFAAAVNGGKSFEGITVSLGADINMTGKVWIPIGNVNDYPGKVFAGIFDGQNHIISNLTCTDNTENNACAALFGGVYGKIKNVTLKDVNISSHHYAGGIGAYCSSSNMDIENCHVIGGTITSSPELIGSEYDNGDKVGGIMGYSGEAGKITGCTVDGVTIRAYRDLGGIAGASSATISNCVVKNSSIIQDNTNAYKTGIDTFHEILGRDMGATLTNNTFENVTVTSSN